MPFGQDIHRRRVLLSGLVALAAFTVPARGVFAAEKTALRLVHAASPRSTAHMLFLRPWAQRLGALSSLRTTVEPLDHGDAAQAFAMLRAGEADLAWGPLDRAGSADARAHVLELPFMAMSAEAQSQAAQELFAGPLADAVGDLRVIFAHADTQAWLHTRDAPVRSLADLAGLRVHAPTTYARDVLDALGADSGDSGSPTAAARAIASGALDGALLSFEAALPAGVIGETRYHTRIGRPSDAKAGIVPRPELATRVFVLAMTHARYGSLPVEARAVAAGEAGSPASRAAS